MQKIKTTLIAFCSCILIVIACSSCSSYVVMKDCKEIDNLDGYFVCEEVERFK